MPRKPSTIAPAIRIRDNQRRARARRKELIDDLKIRVREYELQGVAATAEVQEAARKVLLENRRLRILLAAKGVSTAEVEEFLRVPEYNASFVATLPAPDSLNVIEIRGQATPPVDHEQPVEVHSSAPTDHYVSAEASPPTPRSTRSGSMSQVANNGDSSGSSDDIDLLQPGERLANDSGRGLLLPNIVGSDPDCYCPAIQPVPSQMRSSGTECNVAADILAGFRGHGDVERARAELGCPDDAHCSITNVALLHALDSEHAGGNGT